MKIFVPVSLVIALGCCLPAGADCPLDHLIIGCNRDGIARTPDDRTLFVDCRQKYRASSAIPYANWFYPLQRSIFPTYPYRIGEPGFDVFQAVNPRAGDTYDPNRSLAGLPDVDYRIRVECLALSPGLRAVHKDYPPFTLDAAGQSFSHSGIHSLRGDSHVHMSYQATEGQDLQWITLRVHDDCDDGDRYDPSEPFTIVFNTAPRAGDLAVDGRIDFLDLHRLSHHWLAPDSTRHNDYWERADANRDGRVDLIDFALLAANWREGEKNEASPAP
jgi:hypothetical protein